MISFTYPFLAFGYVEKSFLYGNKKGDAGKTVTPVCLGACLAQDNKKVLIVDFDSQNSITKKQYY